jgi:hypothetical protein
MVNQHHYKNTTNPYYKERNKYEQPKNILLPSKY